VAENVVALGLLLIVCAPVPEDGRKLLSPAYAAVKLCAPASNELVLITALPVASRLAVPIGPAPSENVTVPLGIPEPLKAATVAVRVTVCPREAGFGLPDKLVVLAVFVTVCEVAAEVDPKKFASPA
jgi:hypothetical protein